ncbi:MAG: hypothetical protein JEY79_12090 [Pseudodesulfovibrio sp.]|nr:hypothetical protein [Pseudodesulfovibrio sp.]
MYILPDADVPPGYTDLEPEDGEYSRWTGEVWEYNLERKGSVVRAERDKRIEEIIWRIQRYESETRLELKPTDDITALDSHVQELRDITNQTGFPTDVEWPQSLLKP